MIQLDVHVYVLTTPFFNISGKKKPLFFSLMSPNHVVIMERVIVLPWTAEHSRVD